MRKLLSTIALLSVLAIPAAAHADNFDFTAAGSGGGFSGTGSFIASDNGDGSWTIDGISGSGITSLVAPDGFMGNDNLLFPGTSSLVDTHGFAFEDTQGNTSFTVNIASVLGGGYQASFLDSDGVSATLPVTFTLTNAATPSATPEPASWMLLGTGMSGLAGLCAASRRRARGTMRRA